MIDLSESGFIGIITNMFFISSLFIAISDLISYVKGEKKLVYSIIFFAISVLILTIGLLTDYIRFDKIGVGFSIFFLLTLLIAIKFRKIIILFWAIFLVISIGFFIAFISYTLKDPEEVLKVNVTKVEGKNIEGYIYYKDLVKEFKIESDMIGFESFQIIIKPYLSFLFGGRRIIITSFFCESFSDNGLTGQIRYYPLWETIINRRKIWQSLESKKFILLGFQGVQRTNVSIYPKEGKYILKWKDGLYFIREE